MNNTCSLHNHSTWCDGKNTPREMILAAIKLGLTDFGISGHSPMPPDFNDGWAMPDENGYLREMESLKREFAGRINVYTGMEADAINTSANLCNLDYVIGAVHVCRYNGRTYGYDHSAADFGALISDRYNGDPYAMARDYFLTLTDWTRELKPDIIGHFDLIRKFNYTGGFFDENDPRYRSLSLEAAEECLKHCRLFELNTGNISRGYGKNPYPSDFVLSRILGLGGGVILSADAHTEKNIVFGFEDARERLRGIGFRYITVLENGAFTEKKL